MKLNEFTQIIGEQVILIPYEAKHVEKYHEWMKSPELQELTASEPLTLQEEYDMQKSWREDDDKLTFLILDKTKYENSGDEIYSLVGDTNLFLQKDDDDLIGEAEIMIAEKSAQGMGRGYESILLMLKYGQSVVKCTKFIARIKVDNVKSIKLFEKIKFVETSRSSVFNEITFECKITKEWIEWIDLQINYTVTNY